MGFLSVLLMAGTIMLVGMLPSAPDRTAQEAYDMILGMTPRIVLASLIAYLIGEFANSYLLAKIKIRTKGKLLRVRTIGSTIIGELLDTGIFVLIAFRGIFPPALLLTLIISNYIFKVGLEVLLTPLTYRVVKKVKKVEQEDHYDYHTDFSIFKL
jgi:uncharacterized integral membrane protein (TIGR00697 family)